MKLTQKIKSFIAAGAFAVTLFAGITVTTAAPSAYAACKDSPPTNCCAGVDTSILTCSQTGGPSSDPTQSGVWGLLILAINILTAGVGLAAVGGVIYGAVLYTTAGGAQEQVKKAIGVLKNVGIGVVAYALMWALLNFLIPGGVFK